MPNQRGMANLIPNSERTPEELKEMTRKGGIASGKARRKKRQTKELIKMVLSMEPVVSDKALDALHQMGYDPETDGMPTVETMMQLMIARNAMSGDLNAAKFLYDYGLIPDMRTQIDRERMKLEREKQLLSKGGTEAAPENNLLEALKNTGIKEVSTDEIPELQSTAESDSDVVV